MHTLPSEIEPALSAPVMLLSSAPAGALLRVARIRDEASCIQRLREFGLISGVLIEVVQGSDPVLMLVRGTRLAIDRPTAACIEVTYASAH